jgi:hypothetical protein
MLNSPEAIIEEYLNQSDPEIRKNAVSALGSVGTNESILRLVEASCNETDLSVKIEAGNEIRVLQGTSLNTAVELLWKNTLQKGQSVNAVHILSELKADGNELSKPHLPWGVPSRLAKELRKDLYPSAAIQFKRDVSPSLLGVFFSFLTACLLSMISLGFHGYSVTPLFGWVFIYFVMFLACAVRIIPMRFNILPQKFYQIDLGGLFFTSLLGWTLFAMWAVAILETDPGGLLALSFISVGFFFVVVRVGTILAYGISDKPRRNSTFQVIVGGSLGMLLILAVSALFQAVDVNDLSDCNTIGSIFIPMGFGLAKVFAVIDNRELETVVHKSNLFRRVLSYLIAGSALLFLLSGSMNRTMYKSSNSQIAPYYNDYAVLWDRMRNNHK